jgi:hypothetical protein
MAHKIFTAMYDGHCPECGDDIEAGDEVVFNDSHEVVHTDCYAGEVYE